MRLSFACPTLAALALAAGVAHAQSTGQSPLVVPSSGGGGGIVSVAGSPVTGSGTLAFAVAQFKAFAGAVGFYVAGLYKAANGGLASLPTAAATIP